VKCWHCNTDLIWGADNDLEDEDIYVMETNLSCPECGSLVLVYLPKEEMDERSETD